MFASSGKKEISLSSFHLFFHAGVIERIWRTDKGEVFECNMMSQLESGGFFQDKVGRMSFLAFKMIPLHHCTCGPLVQ